MAARSYGSGRSANSSVVGFLLNTTGSLLLGSKKASCSWIAVWNRFPVTKSGYPCVWRHFASRVVLACAALLRAVKQPCVSSDTSSGTCKNRSAIFVRLKQHRMSKQSSSSAKPKNTGAGGDLIKPFYPDFYRCFHPHRRYFWLPHVCC